MTGEGSAGAPKGLQLLLLLFIIIIIIIIIISSLRAFRRAREGAAKGRSSWVRSRWPDAKIEGTGAKCDLRNEQQREKREQRRERREQREESREGQTSEF